MNFVKCKSRKDFFFIHVFDNISKNKIAKWTERHEIPLIIIIIIIIIMLFCYLFNVTLISPYV